MGKSFKKYEMSKKITANRENNQIYITKGFLKEKSPPFDGATTPTAKVCN